ncbi:uncharacterized protein BJ171DRAFT_144211 [Polychytrium aggregatum]|uniref:uncharacterized protein n=1 Tax=Polychytrium aggregatum TaxID=110093 RepID=UPI0022FEC4D1|nr:uncharacterized protein BJ171DRAFT_144211 [Polychytrium aggregatum]KAI9203455.1 hypothetical protein BJ171DRAFT_144211 [Polychytrium aggregatum]
MKDPAFVDDSLEYVLVRTQDVQPQKEALRQVSELIVEALGNESFSTAMFPDPRLRPRLVPWVFYRRLLLSLPASYVLLRRKPTNQLILESGDRIYGHMAASSPDTQAMCKPSLWTMLKLGLWMWPFLFNWVSIIHFFRCMDAWDSQIKHRLSNAWVFEQVAVPSDLRGQGLGSKMLRLCLDTIVDKHTRVVLTTQRESNVRFYKRFGFQIVEDDTVHYPQNLSFRNWVMQAHPQ